MSDLVPLAWLFYYAMRDALPDALGSRVPLRVKGLSGVEVPWGSMLRRPLT